MGMVQWNSSLSVGIDEIDKQHQKLFALINELDEAMRKGKGKEVISKTIEGLNDYVKYHFKAEEKMFLQCGYPEAALHKKIHDEFIQKAINFKKDLESGKLNVASDVLVFLNNWLVNHIKGLDKKYAPYLTEKCAK